VGAALAANVAVAVAIILPVLLLLLLLLLTRPSVCVGYYVCVCFGER